jgi:NAD(P)-dependent dehydrogenase (short-subunit alcohol dehydrogenase family)
MEDLFSLKGRNLIVTGGSKGIGEATVLLALSKGANVLAVARGEKGLANLAKRVQEEELAVFGSKISQKSQFETLAVDVATQEGRDAIVEKLRIVFGNELHGLVNNAGTNIRKQVQEYTDVEWRTIIELNQHAPFELCRALYPLLKNANVGASIVNVASVAGFMDVRSGTPYAMSKSAMIQMSRSLASEWATIPIRVNSVSPWYTKTPLVEPVLKDSARLQKIIENTPLGRIAEASEVASVICFLLMEASSYMTGQNLITDGGMSIQAL